MLTLDDDYESWKVIRPGTFFRCRHDTTVSWPADGLAMVGDDGFPILYFSTINRNDVCLTISIKRSKVSYYDDHFFRLDVVVLVNGRLTWTRLESIETTCDYQVI